MDQRSLFPKHSTGLTYIYIIRTSVLLYRKSVFWQVCRWLMHGLCKISLRNVVTTLVAAQGPARVHYLALERFLRCSPRLTES